MDKKLLIIATPKTASTSLLEDLISITKLDGKQEFRVKLKPEKHKVASKKYLKNVVKTFLGKNISKQGSRLRDAFPCYDYPFLRFKHSDICDLSCFSNDDLNYNFPLAIHKQHFPPTIENITVLKKNFNIVFIYTNPEKVVESYKRVDINNNKSIEYPTAFKEGLLADLKRFNEGWLNEVPTKNQFQKEEILDEPFKCINRCLYLLNCESKFVDKKHELPHKRYYR